jgi:carbon storage regulator
MLVLSRKSGEGIQIGDRITVKVIESRGNRVRLGISAPEEVEILREEVAAWREQWQDDTADVDTKRELICT